MTNEKSLRLIVNLHGEDISEEIELGKGRSNPFGWSTRELIHVRREGEAVVPTKIGYLYCGSPIVEVDGYAAEIIEQEDA